MHRHDIYIYECLHEVISFRYCPCANRVNFHECFEPLFIVHRLPIRCIPCSSILQGQTPGAIFEIGQQSQRARLLRMTYPTQGANYLNVLHDFRQRAEQRTLEEQAVQRERDSWAIRERSIIDQIFIANNIGQRMLAMVTSMRDRLYHSLFEEELRGIPTVAELQRLTALRGAVGHVVMERANHTRRRGEILEAYSRRHEGRQRLIDDSGILVEISPAERHDERHDERCNICLAELPHEGETIVRLACGHEFGRDLFEGIASLEGFPQNRPDNPDPPDIPETPRSFEP
ncbi:hypothetical protein PVAG01_07087 [Phlyctema vagabunda]|uniref:RING-type domain-containing protein n=1 Tax=Phlyctema vagabunda TaxID=108571 RepID=A0ABR4PBF4_9HELO